MKIDEKNASRFCLFWFVLITLLIIPYGFSYPKEQAPLMNAKLPLLITSSGQSPGGEIVKVLCNRNKIKCDFSPRAKAEHLKGINTLMIVMGSSMKGMGAAGVSITDELTRTENLIKAARKEKILIVGLHIEGEARRTGDCEEIIDLVSPQVDYLIVRSDGNKDGRFDRISKEKKIPLTIIDETLELNELLKKMFQM